MSEFIGRTSPGKNVDMGSGEDKASSSREKILQALASPNFFWRTIPGVAAETKTNAGDVLGVIYSSPDIVVQSSRVSPDGQDLYTTREHYKDCAPLGDKIMGAILNR